MVTTTTMLRDEHPAFLNSLPVCRSACGASSRPIAPRPFPSLARAITADPALPENPTAQRLADLCDWWLEARCACGRTTYFPLLFMASRQPQGTTLGGVMARLRCSTCKREPATLALVDDPSRGEKGKGGGQPWVRVVLRGG